MKGLHKLIFLIVIFALCNMIASIEKVSNLKDALSSYPSKDQKTGGRPKFIYIKMRENLPRSIDYYSSIFFKFLSTVGVRPYFVNMNDTHLLGIVRFESEIDVEIFKENFEDLIENIEVKEKI